MDKTQYYRELIQQILQNEAAIGSQQEGVETQVITDTVHDHYQLLYVGWNGYQRIFGPIMHFDIKNGKIWIQYNGTEEHIAETLTQLGVPASDIVLGFRSAFKRQFTGYAVE
jgi:hypothetical protein